MTNIHDIQAEYVDIIEAAVTDYNTARNNSTKWVYDDSPAANLDAKKYPRISVLGFTADNKYHELGSSNYRTTATIEVQIKVKKGEKWNLGGTTYTDIEAVSKLADDVIDALRGETVCETLRTSVHVFYHTLEQEETLYTDDQIIKILRYSDTFVR